MSKYNKSAVKEVPRYQLIEIPGMFIIMAAIGILIYGITVCVGAFKGSEVARGILLIVTSLVSLFTLGSSAWAITNSNNPKKSVPMIIFSAAELAFFIAVFFLNKYIGMLVAIIMVPLLALQLAGAIVLKVKGTKIMNSLPPKQPIVHHSKKKKKK